MCMNAIIMAVVFVLINLKLNKNEFVVMAI